MERGWIKIWRRLEDSEVFQDPILLKVWLWCLMKASHKTEYIPVKTGRGITTVEVHRGQFLFGRKEAAKALLLPPSTVRNKMSRLGTLRNLDMQPDTHFSIVTICNYNDYQTIDEYELDRQQDRQRTGKGQAKDTYKNVKNVKDVKDVKNVKNVKNVKKEPKPSSEPSGFVAFWTLYPRKVGKAAARKAWAAALRKQNGDLLGKCQEALEWQKASDQWQRNGGQFVPNPATWLNQERWDDEGFEERPHVKGLWDD